MSEIHKINFFKSNVGIDDDNLAKHYLLLTNGDKNQAVQLFLNEQESNRNMILNNNQNNVEDIKIEFLINNEILSNKEVYIQNNKNIYTDLNTFLFEKFVYISNDIENYMTELKKHAGLIIIFSKEKVFNVRNDMNKVYNDQLCQDIIRNVVIFPVMNDSKIGKEFIKVCNQRNYPLYLFCKFKTNIIFDINYRMEKQFNITKAVNNFLECFPESEVKQSVFRSLNETVMNLRNSLLDVNNRNNNNNNNSLLSDPNNFYTGNLDELIAKLSQEIDQSNNNLNNDRQYNNSHINNLENSVQRSNNNINNNNSYRYNESQNNNDYNQINDNINNNRSQNNVNFDYNNSNNINQSISSNQNYNNNNQSINNHNSINNSVHNSLNENNPRLQDSIYGLSAGEIMAKREREIRELERQQEEKIKKEQEEKQKILNEENEKKMKSENYEKEALICKQNLPVEPDENNINACKIMFRYPNGEKSVERRFIKYDKIIMLYNYVKSLGREIFFESNSNDFELICGFPPKNLENSKDKTLVEEGLFPSSLIQIKEKNN